MDRLTALLLERHAQELPPLAGYPLTSHRFAVGEKLAASGDPLTSLCFVAEGRATVHRTLENGSAVLLREYGGLHTVGELELLMGYPTLTGDVRALTAGALLALPLPATRERIFADPVLLAYLGREVARKLEHTSRIAAQDHFYPLAERLAAYLLYARRGDRLPLNWMRVSDLMGASYRHQLRVLHDFCEAGWLVRAPEGYRIRDEAALRLLGGAIRYD